MTIGRLVQFVTPLVFSALAFPAQAGFGGEHPVVTPAQRTLVCSNSTRSVRQLAMIDHTSDGGFQCLGVYVEGDAVKAIRLERHTFAPRDGRPEVEQIKVVEFSPTIVDSPRGAVIDGVPGHDAIVLHGRFTTPPDKGELVLSYLYNGITGEYHSCRIVLDRTPDSGWRLVNRFDQPISLIMVRIRQLPMIGVVGIANLEGACT
jgi:hypothetical protein